ncbi:hypothetical protein [Rheinheimera sp. 4Y26]|uniref:hypothetical protein n=1 Tax=Rheinheimera sp. 4Y26 TaxID=2977811 RepID=UPI0021B0F861|nr:hypothetical protein [Rheinheimera sp. 4Y26]MCT6700928.1 hypothetical protein [Rheinheimera sp. 4Y26]
MTAPLSPPGVVFSAANKGGDYLAKLQLLAQGVDTAVNAFNAQLEAAETADQIRLATAQIKNDVQVIQTEINQALAAAYAAIGTAGDTATYATQLVTARLIGQKPFDGTANIQLDTGDITGLQEKLDDIELTALMGL